MKPRTLHYDSRNVRVSLSSADIRSLKADFCLLTLFTTESLTRCNTHLRTRWEVIRSGCDVYSASKAQNTFC